MKELQPTNVIGFIQTVAVGAALRPAGKCQALPIPDRLD